MALRPTAIHIIHIAASKLIGKLIGIGIVLVSDKVRPPTR